MCHASASAHRVRQQGGQAAGRLPSHPRPTAGHVRRRVRRLGLPLGEEEKLHGVADVLTDEGLEYDTDGTTTSHYPPTSPTRHRLHDEVVEEIVAGDDEQLERYLSGEVPTAAELERTLAGRCCGAPSSRCCSGRRRPQSASTASPTTSASSARRPPIAQRRSSAGPRVSRSRQMGHISGLRVQDGGRPVRRPGVAVQGPVRHRAQRRPSRQLGDIHRRADARPVPCAARSTSPPPRWWPATSAASPSWPPPGTRRSPPRAPGAGRGTGGAVAELPAGPRTADPVRRRQAVRRPRTARR